VLIANAEGELKELDFLGGFKADLRSFTRSYEFMSHRFVALRSLLLSAPWRWDRGAGRPRVGQR